MCDNIPCSYGHVFVPISDIPNCDAAAARAEGAMCIPLEQCIGQDRFDPSLNSCGRAECAKYFYSTYNEDEGDCSLDQAALAIGLIFLISCILMEIWSYLLVHIGNHYCKYLHFVYIILNAYAVWTTVFKPYLLFQ